MRLMNGGRVEAMSTIAPLCYSSIDGIIEFHSSQTTIEFDGATSVDTMQIITEGNERTEGEENDSDPERQELPVVADADLINLYDNYNYYLINEEIVYTEALTYETTTTSDPNAVIVTSSDELPFVACPYDIEGDAVQEIDTQMANMHANPSKTEFNISGMLRLVGFINEDFKNNSLPGQFPCLYCESQFSNKCLLADHHQTHGIWT